MENNSCWNEYTNNPNNLPVVRTVHSKEAILAGTEKGLMAHFISSSVQSGDNPFIVSAYLVPSDIQEYDFVWLEEEGVEAMWSNNEFILDRSEPAQPFKSSMSVMVLDWMFINWKAMLLAPIGLLAWWLVAEFGVKGAIINVVAWALMWFAYGAIKRAINS